MIDQQVHGWDAYIYVLVQINISFPVYPMKALIFLKVLSEEIVLYVV